MLVQIGILILLIALNGFFAGSEIAFISLNNMKLKSLAEEGKRKAALVLALKEIPTNFLSTIQIGVSLASMLSGAFASDAFASLLTDWIVGNGISSVAVVKPISMLVITLATSFLMLVFGELVPKRMAMNDPQKFAFFVVYQVWILSKVAIPLIKLLSVTTNLVLRMVGIDPNKAEDEVTEDEIRLMVDAGEIDVSEKEMINNVFDFDNTDVSDIMTHRTDVIAFDIETELEEILKIVEEERFTRYPVYEGSIDNIIGILHLRDLLAVLHYRENIESFDLKSVLREPIFVPDSKLTNSLFAELTDKKTHIAIVIDEYGGTAGIVTLEDLIEEIMGNIMDEYDEDEELEIVTVHDGEYLVDGSCDLDDLAEFLDVELPIDEYDTVSGYIVGSLGRMPQNEDINNPEAVVVDHGYLFTIVELDEKVISKARVIRLDVEENEED